MKRNLLLATGRATETQLNLLGSFAEVHQLTDLTEPEIDASLPNVQLILLHGWPSIITEERIRMMKHLEFIQSALAGVNHIPFRLLRDTVVICSNAGAYSNEVAEYAFALTLAAAKRIAHYDHALKSGTWVEKPQAEIGKDVMVLRNKTIGILGYGGIGRSVARVARSLGMEVLTFTRKRVREKNVGALYGRRGLGKLLSSSDVVVSALPLTRVTDRLIGGGELSLMKTRSILVNVGRAEVVDQASLYEHLLRNPDFCYATDVWWLKNGKEALAPEYPLLHLPNFIGTPHASGPSAYVTGRPMELAVQNTLRYLKGLKPRNIVKRSDYI